MELQQIWQRHTGAIGALLAIGYVLVNNSINASSVLMEQTRRGVDEFASWEPWVWEMSSAAGTLLMLPLVFWLLRRPQFSMQTPLLALMLLTIGGLIFSFGHIGIMVLLRELIYELQDLEYNFNFSWFELIYELRKDIWSFFFWVIAYRLYHYLLQQLLGEARVPDKPPISSPHKSLKESTPEQLLVKKLGREFIVQLDDIEWLESSGNYVNLHTGDQVYPMRATITKLTEQLESRGFIRIHRSYAVKHSQVGSIKHLSSGDAELALKSGQRLPVSRRFKDVLKPQFIDLNKTRA